MTSVSVSTARLADRQPSPHARLALAGMAVAQAEDGEVEARVAEMTAALRKMGAAR